MTPEDLVGLTEIAAYCGVSVSAASNWRKRHRSFPTPWGEWPMGALWVREEVEAWWADRMMSHEAMRQGAYREARTRTAAATGFRGRAVNSTLSAP